MAKAKTNRTRKRKVPPGNRPPNLVRLEDAYRQLRDQGLEPNEAVQRLKALLRQWPSWIRRVGFRGKIGHVSFRGKETWELWRVAFWQNEEDILSVGMDATGADCLVINFTDYAHPSVSYERPQFFMRAGDIGREVHLDEGGSNVISDYHDYHPYAEFERELEGRPRPLTRLPPTPEAPPPASQTAADRQLENKIGPDPIEAEADDGLSVGQPPQKSKAEGWQVRRVKQALKEKFPPDGRPPVGMTLKAILKSLEESFERQSWKLASPDTLARAMERRET